ncbi:hypothetical protein [Ureibacillus chungkukjangi]|nr:hypothetical protein [Ureibacillus chungkukjangi]
MNTQYEIQAQDHLGNTYNMILDTEEECVMWAAINSLVVLQIKRV